MKSGGRRVRVVADSGVDCRNKTECARRRRPEEVVLKRDITRYRDTLCILTVSRKIRRRAGGGGGGGSGERVDVTGRRGRRRRLVTVRRHSRGYRERMTYDYGGARFLSFFVSLPENGHWRVGAAASFTAVRCVCDAQARAGHASVNRGAVTSRKKKNKRQKPR